MIYLDIETYSELDLTVVGTMRYAQNCEVMLISYCVDDGPVQTWDLTTGEPMPEALLIAFYDENDALFAAHNTYFERTVLREALGIDIPAERWHDSMILAMTCGLPGKLETLCTALSLDEDHAKLKDGSALVNMFCKPAPSNHKAARYTRENKPEKWARFIQYCERDAELVRLILQTLPRHTYDLERTNWLLDQEINDRGLPVDVDLATAAMSAIDTALEAANEELRTITGGAVTAVSEASKITTWVNDQGVDCFSINKDSVSKLLDTELSPAVRRVLEIRQQSGKSSGKKYAAAIEGAVDGRLYGTLQFYGALRTGRWAGRQLQPQNMYRPTIKHLATARRAVKHGTADILYDDVIEVTSSCIRTVIAAPKGRKLVVADLANIEGRVLAWLAGEEWKLQAFRDFDAGIGHDLYKLTYSRTFGVPVDQVTKDQRQVGKVMELAFGFGGSAGAFKAMAAMYGVELSDREIEATVQGWRQAHPRIRSYWYDTEKAAHLAVERPGRTITCRREKWHCLEHNGHRWLCCKLDTGRHLMYYNPVLGTLEKPWGEVTALFYHGLGEQYQYGRISTWGGKFVENITQARARDELAKGMHRAAKVGYDPVLTVHDEVVTETPDSDEFTAEGLSALLAESAAGYRDLPLAAEGYEDYYYHKG